MINKKGIILTTLFTVIMLLGNTIFAVEDSVPPVIGIAINAKEVKAGGSITYTINTTDDVGVVEFDVTRNDITLVGFSADVSISGSGLSPRYVTLSNIKSTTNSSKKYITVAAGIAKDIGNNLSSSVSSPWFTISTVDIVPPVIGIGAPSTKTVEAGGTVTYKINATDDVKLASFNVTKNDIILNGFDATVTVSDNTVTLTNIKSTTNSNSKYITVKAGVAKDAAGNTSAQASSAAFTITKAKDAVPPVIGISAPNPKTVVEGGKVVYTVNATDDVGVAKFTLTKNDIILNGFSATVTVSGNTVTLTNVKSTTNSNSKYITVKAGVAKDAAGNTSSQASSAAFTITKAKDTVPPVIGISAPNPKTVAEGGKVVFTVNATDDVAVTKFTLTKNDIILNGFSATVTVSGNTVTLTNVKSTTNSNSKYITVKAGVAQDADGNTSAQASSSGFTITKAQQPTNKDTIAPVVTIGKASPSGVYRGGKVTYVLTFSDDIAVTEVNLTANDIKLNGFTANIAISGTGLKTRTVTLTNIRGNVGNNYTITVGSGVIKDAEGNVNVKVTSPRFSILKQTVDTIVPSTPATKPSTTPSITANCIDDLSLLGDINKEITYFSSWLRAEKYTASYVQENNYVGKDERMTYMVEYYNGSTAPAPNVVFTLTIPYKVEVEEINGNGYVKSQTENETVIEWNMGKIASKAYCRLYVRVKFGEDTALKNSTDISKIFYTTLKTTASGNTSYSYMRQLYIDKTTGKKGTFKSYLTALDSSNSIRPEDEITRAEFAKLLADCGIITVDSNSTAYKTYSDWESIPVYARTAVAALTGTDIIQAFPDGTFKPNNPILMEDAIQMVAQAATYISNQKLTVLKPTFLYTSALKDSNGDLSEKKNYIMELMRQNVIVKYESRPDDYALRKDVVGMVNALTFRGPYVEKLPANTMKFVDIREDSVYFYDIIGASNSYTYTYDYRLWQEIVEIQK